MFEFIRLHASVLSALLLGWMTYGDLEEPNGKKASAKGKLQGIHQRYLEMRDPDQELLPVLDPTRLERDLGPDVDSGDTDVPAPVEPRGRVAAVPQVERPQYTPEQMADAWAGTVHSLTGDALAGLSAWDPFGWKARAAESRKGPKAPPPAHFVLRLDSTLGTPEGGQARISGQTLVVGQALVGLDSYSPPVLVSVSGSAAVVRWRDEVFLLDLDARPIISVGGPAPGRLAPARGATPTQVSPRSGKKTSTGSRIRGKAGRR